MNDYTSLLGVCVRSDFSLPHPSLNGQHPIAITEVNRNHVYRPHGVTRSHQSETFKLPLTRGHWGQIDPHDVMRIQILKRQAGSVQTYTFVYWSGYIWE